MYFGAKFPIVGALAGRDHRPVDTGRSEPVQHAVQHDEDRHLDQEGQAPAERVDLVLLVELHQLFVELLPVALVLLLDLLHLGLEPLHLQHRLRALEGQRREQHHHREGEERDGDGVVGDQAVEPSQDCGDGVEHLDGLPLRHRVEPMPAPRMAPTEAPRREGAAPQGAVRLESLERVGRTAGNEAARRRPSRTKRLVHEHRPAKEASSRAHAVTGGRTAVNKSWRVADNVAKVMSAAGGST